MPLDILLILVIGGISAIALLLHLLGKSRRVVMDAEDARGHWHRHFPDDTVVDVTVAHDGHAALVRTGQGPGLVWSFGADTVARHLRDFDLVDTDHGFDVMFHDFTAPKVALHLDDFERPRWRNMMMPQ